MLVPRRRLVTVRKHAHAIAVLHAYPMRFFICRAERSKRKSSRLTNANDYGVRGPEAPVVWILMVFARHVSVAIQVQQTAVKFFSGAFFECIAHGGDDWRHWYGLHDFPRVC